MIILLENKYTSSPFNGFNKKKIRIKKNYEVSSRINRTEINLLPFNTKYWEGLPEDKNQLYLDMDNGKYFTATSNGYNIGIVGVFINNINNRNSFFQIYVDPDYRGLGLIRPIAYKISKKFNINKLVSIIDKKD